MLKSPSSNGDSFSQTPLENTKRRVDSDGSSGFDEEESSTSALEIVQLNEKRTDFVDCVKNEPIDNSAELLLDDSLRLQIERSIEIVVNEFSFASTSCNSTSSVTSMDVVSNDGSEPEKLGQCVMDSSSTKNCDVTESKEQPLPNSSVTFDSSNDNSMPHVNRNGVPVDSCLTSTTASYSASALYSNRSTVVNVKSEPRDTTNHHLGSVKTAAAVPSSHVPPSTSAICSNGSTVSADFKPYSESLRPNCLYSTSTKSYKEIAFGLTSSITTSSMIPPPKVCSSAFQMDKMTNNVCQISVKPISRAISSARPPSVNYSSHSTLLDGDPRRLGPNFISSSPTFPDCCGTSKLHRTQFPSEPSRYQPGNFSSCLIRKNDSSFSTSCSSLSSTLTTSTSPSLSSLCFCTNSCCGKPCSKLPSLQNQLLGNASLSQRALNLHHSYDLYPKTAGTGSVPVQVSQSSFDYFRPKSSGPSCFRVPSSPISRYGMPSHVPPKDPLSPHMTPLAPPYNSSTVSPDLLGSKSSSSFFGSTSPKSLKNWSGSPAAAAAAAATAAAACMLQSSAIPQPAYKFPMPRIPLSSASSIPSSYVANNPLTTYVHSSSMSAPPPAPPSLPGFADLSNVSTPPRLYNVANAPSLINTPVVNGLKSPQHQQSSILQQYPFGSSLQKSQCCFPSQLQCYTNCCKEAQQQFSFV